ncbi:hypothetical protein C8J56DRAFT_181651 [Mycena floridula]|nr:hypothetical protein C8J56DRAFT_181651 [Mycena floridula]
MVHFNTLFVTSLVLGYASAGPILHKRIAQVIADATADWEKACLAAGGADKCNPISQTAFTSLLAAGGNCDQQDAADSMIDLAKTLNNDPEMIRLAQLFVQQPRNAPDSLQVPYCQVAPKNSELNGLFHCQFAGTVATHQTFSGDQTGNVPLGLTAVSPPGSCPAKTDGPVPDGVQLNTLVTDPGVGSSSTGTGTGSTDTTGSTPVTTSAPASTTTTATGSTGSTGSTSSTASGFQLQNGEDAIALNAKFASLTASSPCTDGDQACVNGAFAQCVGGSFALTQCAASTSCFALPLVNKAGTTITCTTQADADARIAATGATA